MDNTFRIKCETEGFEEAKEEVEALAQAYDGFPAQVVIRNCRDCTINVYPTQIRNGAEGRQGRSEGWDH